MDSFPADMHAKALDAAHAALTQQYAQLRSVIYKSLVETGRWTWDGNDKAVAMEVLCELPAGFTVSHYGTGNLTGVLMANLHSPFTRGVSVILSDGHTSILYATKCTIK